MEYKKVTPETLGELRKIFGDRNVMTEAEKIESYSYDEGGKQFSHMPEVVVKAENEEQIVQLMKLANREHIPVTHGVQVLVWQVALFHFMVASCSRWRR